MRCVRKVLEELPVGEKKEKARGGGEDSTLCGSDPYEGEREGRRAR